MIIDRSTFETDIQLRLAGKSKRNQVRKERILEIMRVKLVEDITVNQEPANIRKNKSNIRNLQK